MKARIRNSWSVDEIQLNEQTTTLTAQLHGVACPSCGSRKYVKNGTEKGNQRYRCGTCRKHFRSTTGNTVHHLHLKPKIQAYMECMSEGLSLRKTAMKLEISLQTAFRWRHRFLSAMNRKPQEKRNTSKVISTYTLPFSSKGKLEKPEKKLPVTSLLQTNITGQLCIDVIGRYGLNSGKLAMKLQGHNSYVLSKDLPRMCKQDTVKCTDMQMLQQTQKLYRQISEWLSKFRGVATKYLDNYWNWFEFIVQLQEKKSEKVQYLQLCL